MAVVEEFWEGFDDYPDTTTSGIGVNSTWTGTPTTLLTGRFGYQCLRQNRNSLAREVTIGTQYVVGFAFRAPILGNANVAGTMILGWLIGTSQQLCIGVDDLGRIRAALTWNGSTKAMGTTIAVSSRTILNNSWHYIEVAVDIQDSDGRIICNLDGKPAFDFTGDTKGQATPNADRIYINGITETSSGCDFDDMYCRSGTLDFFGECKLRPLFATEDELAEWTRLSGSNNFEMIDDLTCDGDTTYNSSNTVGQKDLFVFEDITDSPSVIHGIMLTTACRKDDGATRVIKNVMKIEGTEYYGEEYSVVANYTFVRQILTTNPATGVAFTKSDINDMSMGYELVE